MTQYIVKRILFSLVVLFVISIVVFTAVRMIPGDVCKIVLNTPDVSQQQCDVIRSDLGLDQPLVTQYLEYMKGVVTGDWGTTIISKREVWGEIKTRVPLTLELTSLSTVFALALAIPIGVVSAMRQDGWLDYGLRFLTIGWLSIPAFWIGTMLIIFPAKWWGYSPPPGYVDIWEDPLKNLEQLYLPAFALGLALSASLARVTRSAMLEVLRQDYIRTATLAQAQLKQIGINIKDQVAPYAQYISTTYQGQYEGMGHSPRAIPYWLDYITERFTMKPARGRINLSYVNDPALETLMDKQRAQFKLDERLQTVKQIEELVAENQYEIYFSTDTRTYFWNNDITNYRPTAWFPYTHIMKTWHDKA